MELESVIQSEVSQKEQGERQGERGRGEAGERQGESQGEQTIALGAFFILFFTGQRLGFKCVPVVSKSVCACSRVVGLWGYRRGRVREAECCAACWMNVCMCVRAAPGRAELPGW